MKRKALVLAIAGALSAPSAWAATDTSGMQFTSASEGFYASVRARYNSGRSDFSGSTIENSSSRFGVRGTNDLGGGLTGFYQYEAGVGINNGDSLSTRVGEVGLRGDFGEVRFGSFWANSYNWSYGSTDVANVNSGNLVYVFGGSTHGPNRPGRAVKAAQYTTPDLNGFQGAIRLDLNNKGSAAKSDENDVDTWDISGVYAIQGFTVAGSYANSPDSLATLPAGNGQDGLSTSNSGANTIGRNTDAAQAAREVGTDDYSSWTIRLGYAQDNWYVNGWYGEDSTGDIGYFNDATKAGSGANAAPRAKAADAETFSVAGGVAIDKVNLYAVYETRDNSQGVNGDEISLGTIGVQYNLGAQTRTWIEYASQDDDTDSAADDFVTIGLQHSF